LSADNGSDQRVAVPRPSRRGLLLYFRAVQSRAGHSLTYSAWPLTCGGA